MTPRVQIKVLSAVAVILIAAAAGLFSALNRPVIEIGVDTVEISAGMSASDIALLLKEKQLIRSIVVFVAISRLTGYSRRFKAGKHPIDDGLSTWGIARLLTENPPIPPDIRVTVIEGLTIRETASVLMEQAGIDSAAFVALATDSSLAQQLGIDNDTLEGYLYPDTYFVRPGTEPMSMIRRMVGQFNTVFDDSLRARALELGMTVREVVILASIIEAEVTIDEERELVSSVFHRRLIRNRPLEANPTIQYALGVKRRILYEDLTVDSPYNTYTHTGLPPGPIASPGRKSIIAALYPADTKYLYFVANGEGGHVFSRTIAEHTRAVRQYRIDKRRARTNK